MTYSRVALKLMFGFASLMLFHHSLFAALPKEDSTDKRGQEAPPVKGTSVSGKEVSAPEPKQPSIIIFFGSWCPPCNVEHDRLTELFTKYEPKGLRIVGVAVNGLELEGSDEEVKPWAELRKPPYPILIGDKKLAESYKYRGIPTVELVDSKGKIAKTLYGLHSRAELEVEINVLLGTPKSLAQILADELAEKNKFLQRVGIHVQPPKGAENIVIASNLPEKVGKKSDPEDLKAMETGKPVIQKEGALLDITFPLHDAKGKVIGAIGLTFKPEPNEKEEDTVTRGNKLVQAIEKQIPSLEALCEMP